MKRSTDRILTTHAGKLPNPTNMAEVQKAKASGDQAKIDDVVTAGILEAFVRQRELKNDIHSDGEFWKGRDETYFAGRTTGVEAKPVTPDNPASMLANMQERHSGQFDDFYAAFDRVGNTPQPGQDNPAPTQRWVITGAMENKDEASSKHEVAVVKAALEKAGYPDKSDPASRQPLLIILSVALMVALSAMTYGQVAAIMVELFPAKIRYTSMSIPYHIGTGYFGGFLPYISQYIVARTGDAYSGLWYTIAVVVMAFTVSLIWLPETSGQDDIG